MTAKSSLKLFLWFCGPVFVIGCASQPVAAPLPLAARPVTSSVKYSEIRPEDLLPEEYRVHPGDFLEVTVTDLVAPGVETVKRCRVSESGSISLPLVPPIHVAGLTEGQVNDAVRWALRHLDM